MSSPRRPNFHQQEAIDFRQGPLRIIAGAGSGKSTTLVDSAIALVTSGAAQPSQILALTFTDASAEDLRQKMHGALLPYSPDTAIDVDTYNAFGGRIVQEHSNLLNLPPNPRLITPGEAFILLWRSIDEITFHSLELSSMRGNAHSNSSGIGTVLSLQGRLADEDREIDDYRDWALGQEDTEDKPIRSDALDRVEMLKQYERSKQAVGAIDFADQIRKAIEVLQDPDVRTLYGQRYRFIMVDEFQDTNYAQRILVRQLGSAVDQNVRVVGDPYQAIYGFRGAAPDNLDRFADTDFPTAKTITLDVNYRSTQPILNVANALWDDAPDASGAVLVAPQTDASDLKPILVTANSLTDEIAWIARKLTDLNDSGTAWSDMTILVRKNAQKKQFRRLLAARDIPIEAIGGSSLFEQPTTRLIISMLSILVDQSDDPSLAHLLSSDRWGIDDAALYQVGLHRQKRGTLFAAAEQFARTTDPIAEQVADCVTTIRRLAQRSRIQSLNATIDDIQRSIFSTLDQIERESLNRFVRLVDDFEAGDVANPTLEELVAYLDLKASDGDDTAAASQSELGTGDTVKIMTIHAAKGLEWPVVIIAAANSADFSMNFYEPVLPEELSRSSEPRPQEIDYIGKTKKSFDDATRIWKEEFKTRETRRLAYVASTRARKLLCITWSIEHPTRKKPAELHPQFAPVRHLCAQIDAPAAEETNAAVNLERFVRSNLLLVNRITHQLALGEPISTIDNAALSAAWERAGGSQADLDTALATTPIRIAALQRNLDYISTTAALLEAASSPDRSLPPRLSLSYTSLSEFIACPHRYYLHRIIGLPPPPTSAAADYGTKVHAVIQAHSEAIAQGTDFDLESAWPNPPTPTNVTSNSGDRIDSRVAFANSIDAYANPLLAEEPFTIRLEGVDVTGFIDRVQECPDGTVEIVDYKTNWDLPSAEKLNTDLQVPIYLLAMRDREQSLNLRVQQGTLFFLRHNYRHTINRNDAELDILQTQIEDYAIQIRGLTPTQHNASPETCTRCDFRQTCRYSADLPKEQSMG